MLLALLLQAQDPYYMLIDKKVGLPSNTVYDIRQDSKGFIWIATNEGLSRFDGFQYKTYRNNQQASVVGSSIAEDRYGRIWYESFDGYMFYVEQDSLHALQQAKPLGYLPIALGEKHLFVMQEKGVDVYELKTLRLVKTIPLQAEELSYCMVCGGKFYLSERLKMYEIDATLKVSNVIDLSVTGEQATNLACVDKVLLVLTRLNIFKKQYKLQGGKLVALPGHYDIGVLRHFTHLDQQYWFTSSKGSFVFDKTGRPLNGGRPYFADKGVSGVMKDRQGNYWFSTLYDGILLVPSLDNILYQYPGYQLQRIVENPDGGYFLGTKSGEVLKLDEALQQQRLLLQTVKKSDMYYLYVDSLKRYLYHVSAGLAITDIDNTARNLDNGVAIKELCRVDDKYFAFAASGLFGLMYNPLDGSSKPSEWDEYCSSNKHETHAYLSRSMSNVRAKSCAFDPVSGKIYYATNLGLYVLTKQKLYKIDEQEVQNSYNKVIFWEGSLFVLDAKGGLKRFQNDKLVDDLGRKYKIPIHAIRAMKRFGHYLFLLTNERILYINLRRLEDGYKVVNVKVQEVNDILLSGEHLLLLSDGKLIKLRFTDKAVDKQSSAIFFVNALKIKDKTFNPHQSHELDHNSNDVHIEYSVLNFGQISQEPVYYKVNDRPWTLTSAQSRSLSFPELSPGTYVIQFKVGDFNKAKADYTLQLNIAPPFWRRWWFVLLVVALVGLAIFAYYKWRLSILIAQNKLLTEKIALEQDLSKSMLTAIKSQMNPHFFYNALNTIQSYIFTNDKRNASVYLAKFSKLTRTILEMSEKERIHLHDEISALTLYLELEKMRFNNDFEFSIEVSEDVDQDMVKIPSMIIQPYVENAVKHGLLHKKGDKWLHLKFYMQQGDLAVHIDDNGIGRKRSGELNRIRSDKHESFSTQANEKRLAILNRGNNKKVGIQIIDKLDINGNALGTTILLLIPIQ